MQLAGLPATSSSTASAAPRSRTSTPSVTAPTSCRSPRSPRCSDEPRCSTPWAMRSSRSRTTRSRRTSSPAPRSPPSAGRTGEDAVEYKLPIAANARAKMMSVRDGFVKLYARKGSGTVVGGVVVGPKASELIFPISIAVDRQPHRRSAGARVHHLPVALPARSPTRPARCTASTSAASDSARRKRRRQPHPGPPRRLCSVVRAPGMCHEGWATR